MDKMVEREPLTQTFLKSCSFSWSETFVLNSDDSSLSGSFFSFYADHSKEQSKLTRFVITRSCYLVPGTLLMYFSVLIVSGLKITV